MASRVGSGGMLIVVVIASVVVIFQGYREIRTFSRRDSLSRGTVD